MCVLLRVETLRHLFHYCSIAKNCWAYIGVLVPTWLRVDCATTYLMRQINLMEVIMIMYWCIRKERNA
jgi:hypothetical protein